MSRSDPTASRHPWPGLILSARPFLGASSLSKEADLDYLVRFSRPENTAGVLTAACGRGVSAIASMNDATLLQALDLARASSGLDVYPVIPNVLGYVREATHYGMVGAGIRQVRRLGARDLLAIGLRGLGSVRRLLVRDFRAVLPLLLEVEMAAFRRFRPPLVLLHSQVTDLMVALGNAEALRIFADVVPRRFGAEPGLVTCNFGALLPALARWRIDVPVIVAPFNPNGFLMKPTRHACESLLEETSAHIIADRVAVGGAESWPGAFDYLRRLDIRSAIVDVAEPGALDAVIASQRHDGQHGSRAPSPLRLPREAPVPVGALPEGPQEPRNKVPLPPGEVR